MKKLISLLLTICFFVLLTSCKSDSDWQKAEHTYSQLGFSVSYKYPKRYNAVSSDDDAFEVAKTFEIDVWGEDSR